VQKLPASHVGQVVQAHDIAAGGGRMEMGSAAGTLRQMKETPVRLSAAEG